MSHGLLHLFTVRKDDSKFVSSCQDNDCTKYTNEKRLYDRDKDRIFCGSRMCRSKLIGDSNTEKATNVNITTPKGNEKDRRKILII